jgi:hypothetical protein
MLSIMHNVLGQNDDMRYDNFDCNDIKLSLLYHVLPPHTENDNPPILIELGRCPQEPSHQRPPKSKKYTFLPSFVNAY